jgi:hypothetical protein
VCTLSVNVHCVTVYYTFADTLAVTRQLRRLFILARTVVGPYITVCQLRLRAHGTGCRKQEVWGAVVAVPSLVTVGQLL